MANALPIVFVVAGGVCLSLVLLALWYSLRALLIRGSGAVSAPLTASRERLLHEKQELLTAIRDVRQEHDVGKVSDDDFARLEQSYRTRAREVLRELEEQLAPYRSTAQRLLEQALGAALPAGVAVAVAGVPGEAAGVPSAAVVIPAAAVVIPAAALCARCRTSNDTDAVFCKKCGERLQSEARA